MVSAIKGKTVGFDADHALAVERTPCPLAFFASNGEIPATHNAGRLKGVSSAFHLGRITRVELKLAKAPVSLAKLYGNNAAASIKDETLDETGLGLGLKSGHGFASSGGSRLSVFQTIQPLTPH